MHKGRIQPLHVLFSLYSEFKNSQVSGSGQELRAKLLSCAGLPVPRGFGKGRWPQQRAPKNIF